MYRQSTDPACCEFCDGGDIHTAGCWSQRATTKGTTMTDFDGDVPDRTEAPAVGTCPGCQNSIFEDENWVSVDVPGDVPDMYHLECATA